MEMLSVSLPITTESESLPMHTDTLPACRLGCYINLIFVTTKDSCRDILILDHLKCYIVVYQKYLIQIKIFKKVDRILNRSNQ